MRRHFGERPIQPSCFGFQTNECELALLNQRVLVWARSSMVRLVFLTQDFMRTSVLLEDAAFCNIIKNKAGGTRTFRALF